MTSAGCTYNGGICHEAVEQCDGCSRKIEYSSSWYCTSCPEPAVRWKIGSCNLATHVTSAGGDSKTKINPLKASKRSKR
jgi:hypothetical protein